LLLPLLHSEMIGKWVVVVVVVVVVVEVKV
jgi:hypothetical protein